MVVILLAGDGITTYQIKSILPALNGSSKHNSQGQQVNTLEVMEVYATFPTNISSFTNDSGYITSSELFKPLFNYC